MEISKKPLSTQQERLYLFLTGIFIASLVSCNLIFQKFFQINIWLPFIGWYTFTQSVGLLPYPITFLVTDIISEIYGKTKANQVVISGLIASLFMLLIVTISDMIPMAPWSPVDSTTFHKVFGLSGAAVFASMMAYLFAQFIDIRLFHYWKRLTNGKHLWLRNNLSTTFSQLVDTIAILSINYMVGNFEGEINSLSALFSLILSMYTFKFFSALFDTPLFYLGVRLLKDKVPHDEE